MDWVPTVNAQTVFCSYLPLITGSKLSDFTDLSPSLPLAALYFCPPSEFVASSESRDCREAINKRGRWYSGENTMWTKIL